MSADKLKAFIEHRREDFDGEEAPTNLWAKIERHLGEESPDPDPLAGFIATHRDAFDDATPPPRLEEAIFGKRTAPLRVSHRRRGLTFLLGIAASMLLLITAAYSIGNRAGYRAGEEAGLVADLEKIDPELAEAERFYQREIASQFTKVKQVNNDPQLRLDLEEIDQATAEIRADLLRVPVSQRATLVNQLIETYRTKLDILLRIQQHIPNGGAALPHKPTTNES